MNTDNVCIFPDTMPKAEVLFPLVQVFDSIVYLRPVENDPPIATELSPFSLKLVEQGLVHFDCPAPLIDNRERFLRLVHDLQHRGDDYAGQLSHLSLAGLGTNKNTESKSSIVSTLLKQTGIQDEQEEQRTMLLWQARLVLKLGEIFDREQEELQKRMERISAREKGLLEKLREEEEHPFSLTKTLATSGGRTDGQLRLRLRAWSRLFALGNQQIPASIFITTSRDAFDLLIEKYELEQHIPAQQMLTLQLPGGSASESFVDQRASFIHDADEMIETLQGLLENPISMNEKNRSDLNGQDSKWASLLEQHFPADGNSRCVLSLYSLPDIEPATFFLDTFSRDENIMQKEKSDDRRTGAVIGILEVEGVN